MERESPFLLSTRVRVWIKLMFSCRRNVNKKMAVLQRLCLAFAKLLRCAEDEMVTEKIIEDKT